MGRVRPQSFAKTAVGRQTAVETAARSANAGINKAKRSNRVAIPGLISIGGATPVRLQHTIACCTIIRRDMARCSNRVATPGPDSHTYIATACCTVTRCNMARCSYRVATPGLTSIGGATPGRKYRAAASCTVRVAIFIVVSKHRRPLRSHLAAVLSALHTKSRGTQFI